MKRTLSLFLMLVLMLCLAVPFAAEETAAPFTFEIPEKVAKTVSIKKADLATYYANTSYFTALSDEECTVLKEQSVKVGETTFKAFVYIRAFSVSDFTVGAEQTAEDVAKDFAASYEKSLDSSLRGTYLSLITLATDVKYEIGEVEDKDKNKKPTLTVYTAVATMQETSQCAKLNSGTIDAKAKEWSGKTFGQQATELDKYLLSGTFASGKRNYSTVDFMEKKSGDPYDFASAAYLLLTRLGYSASIVTGTDKTGGDHDTAWLLVKYKDHYYHCDIYGNATFDGSGKVTTFGSDYLMVSTETIKLTHTVKTGSTSQIDAATANYDFSEKPVDIVERSTLKSMIDTAGLEIQNEAKYTTASFKAFSDAYTTAKQVYNDSKSTDEQVTQAYNALKSAYDKLAKITKVNKNALAELLKKSYDANLYVADSYYDYQIEVKNAMKVYESKDASQTQVDTTVDQLKTAQDNLVLILDKEALMYYVNNIDSFIYNFTLNLSDESIEGLKQLRDEFRTLYDNGPITDEALKDAANKYGEAVKHIEAQEEIRASENVQQGEQLVPSTPSSDIAQATDIRSVLVLIAAITTVLALASVILYFRPPKFLR